ncbi:uncharacterized protein LOC135501083 [Lineus longissimus]|uniref:uncharacterized protein LOC135501083 n=1 Tax=Lineus longissimus TaxID=88925 RepID=UPI002B4C52AC
MKLSILSLLVVLLTSAVLSKSLDKRNAEIEKRFITTEAIKANLENLFGKVTEGVNKAIEKGKDVIDKGVETVIIGGNALLIKAKEKYYKELPGFKAGLKQAMIELKDAGELTAEKLSELWDKMEVKIVETYGDLQDNEKYQAMRKKAKEMWMKAAESPVGGAFEAIERAADMASHFFLGVLYLAGGVKRLISFSYWMFCSIYPC